MADDKQMQRFRQAVEDKNEEARARGEQAEPRPEDDDAPQQEPRDEQDERAKSSRHGQVTADNWNQ